MDPLSASASIIAMLHLGNAVVKYLNDFKIHTEDRRRLVVEISSLNGLLFTVKDLVVEDPKRLETAKILTAPNGPLEQYHLVLEHLVSKLGPTQGQRRVGASLAWPLARAETQRTLNLIEQLKINLSLALTDGQLTSTQQIKDDISQIRHEVDKIRIFSDKSELPKFLAWLSPLNFGVKQSDISKIRQRGTGEWLLNSKVFRNWIDGQSETLWCPGIPGSGKTVLTSFVVDFLEESFPETHVGIAYIYCSYKEHRSQNASNLIASLLRQLLEGGSYSELPMKCINLYERHVKTNTRPTLSELSILLQAEVSRFSKVFIIIDALDECPEGDGTRDAFLDEIRKLQSHINLFVTSRHNARLAQEFETVAQVEILASDTDIKTYIQHRVLRESRLARFLGKDSILQEEIINVVVSKAQGMFLLARLYLDSLAAKTNRRALRAALHELPKNLHDTYDEAFARIWRQSEEEAQLAKSALSWIVQALRPMTIDELQCALAISPGDRCVDLDAMPDEDILVSVCAGMVTIDQESRIIRLVHYSTQEYLSDVRDALLPDAQMEVATTCLTCLSFDGYDAPCFTDKALKDRLQQAPLLDYAAKNWGNHIRGDLEILLKEKALCFLDHAGKISSCLQVMHLTTFRYPNYSQRYPRDVSGLHLAAFFGLVKLTPFLLVGGADVDSESKYYGTAIEAAALGGHEAVVRLLIERGASINLQSGKYNTPLQAAAAMGHEAVARVLIESGAAVDMQGGLCDSALHAAAAGGHVAVGKILLHSGANVMAKRMDGPTPLHCAASNGHEDMVQMLLDLGADPNTMDGDHGRSPLSCAAWSGHERVARLLLDRGAKIDAVDHQYSTALHLALEKHHRNIVALLVDRGARLDVVNSSQKTQAQMALESIRRINPLNFELDIDLTKKLEPGSQAEVGVYRRKKDSCAQQEKHEYVIRKSFQIHGKLGRQRQINMIREHELLQNLRHPNIVKYFAYEEDQEHFKAHLFTEYCNGGDLSRYTRNDEENENLLEENRPSLSILEIWNIFSDLAAALAYCHHGLVKDDSGSFYLKDDWVPILHRDIKPANVVMSYNEFGIRVVKLCDLGWAKVWNDPKGRQTRGVGTDLYMPKEVLYGGHWTLKGDIHSLGATIRDLRREGSDEMLEQLLGRCTSAVRLQRPSCFTILQVAREKVAELSHHPQKPEFLPDVPSDTGYLLQAIFEVLNRLFGSYKFLSSKREENMLSRIGALISDGEDDIEAQLSAEESLHLALVLEDMARVERLIKNGETGSQCRWNNCGFTALHIASRKGLLTIVQLLLTHNIDLEARTQDGWTPMHSAASQGHAAILRVLVEKGAKLKVQDNEGSTPLHRAAENGHVAALEVLLETEVDVQAQDKEGATPLHRAAENGHDVITERLLASGANAQAKDSEQATPLQRAKDNCRESVVRILSEASTMSVLKPF